MWMWLLVWVWVRIMCEDVCGSVWLCVLGVWVYLIMCMCVVVCGCVCEWLVCVIDMIPCAFACPGYA